MANFRSYAAVGAGDLNSFAAGYETPFLG